MFNRVLMMSLVGRARAIGSGMAKNIQNPDPILAAMSRPINPAAAGRMSRAMERTEKSIKANLPSGLSPASKKLHQQSILLGGYANSPLLPHIVKNAPPGMTGSFIRDFAARNLDRSFKVLEGRGAGRVSGSERNLSRRTEAAQAAHDGRRKGFFDKLGAPLTRKQRMSDAYANINARVNFRQYTPDSGGPNFAREIEARSNRGKRRVAGAAVAATAGAGAYITVTNQFGTTFQRRNPDYGK